MTTRPLSPLTMLLSRHTRRRAFITLIGGAAAAWPLAARAQQPAKLPTIGFLGAGTLSAWSLWVGAFVQRLRELGWIEGRTVVIDYRWAEGRTERYAEIAAEFVRLKVDVIVTVGGAVAAAKQATATIPIVFAAAGDPVGSGMVASLGQPGGNVTGLSAQSTDLAGKRVEILREIFPDVRRLAIIGNVEYSATVLEMGEAQAAARTLGLEVVRSEIRRAEDIAPAFEALKGVAQALYVCPDATINANHARIYTLALGARLPTMHGLREYVEAGQPVWRFRTLCSACQQRAQRGRLGRVSRIYFRSDAAFAMPEVYEFLEAERIKYAIRLPPTRFCRAGSAICSRAQSDDLRTMCAVPCQFQLSGRNLGPSRGGLSPRSTGIPENFIPASASS